jgi:hypothetical protein
MSVQLSSLENITRLIIAEARRPGDPPSVDPAPSTARVGIDLDAIVPSPDQFSDLRGSLGDRLALSRALGHITTLVLGSLIYTRTIAREYAFFATLRDRSKFPNYGKMHISESGGVRRIASIGELEVIARTESPGDPTAQAELFYEMVAEKVRTVAVLLSGIAKAYVDEEIKAMTLIEEERQAKDPEHVVDARSIQREAEASARETFPTVYSGIDMLGSMLTDLRSHYMAWHAHQGRVVRNGRLQSADSEAEITDFLAGMRSDRSSPLGIYNMMRRGVHPLISGGTEKRVQSGQEQDYIENLRGDKGLQMGVIALFDTALINFGLGSARGESRGQMLGRYDTEKGTVARNFGAFNDADYQTNIVMLIRQAERVADSEAARKRGLTPRQAEKFAERMLAASQKAGMAVIRRERETGKETVKRASSISGAGPTVVGGIEALSAERAAEMERGTITAMQRPTREEGSSARVQRMMGEALSAAMRSVESARVSAGPNPAFVARALAAFAAPVIRGLVEGGWCSFSQSDDDTAASQGLMPGRMSSVDAASVALRRRDPARLRSAPSNYFLYNMVGLTNVQSAQDAERLHDHFNPDQPTPEEMERRGSLPYTVIEVSPTDISEAFEAVRGRLPEMVGRSYAPHLAALEEVIERHANVLPARRQKDVDAVVSAYAHLGGRLGELVSALAGLPEGKTKTIDNLYDYVRDSVLDPIRSVDVAAVKRNAARANVPAAPIVARNIEAELPPGPARDYEMAAAARGETSAFIAPEVEEPTIDIPSGEEEGEFDPERLFESRVNRRGSALLDALHLKLLRRAAEAQSKRAARR